MAISKINSKALVDCSVAAVDIEDGSITNAKLAGSIANAKLANSSITVNGNTVSLGASGNIPPVAWQSVVTADGSTTTTAVSGNGYFIDTTSAAHTITLPASPSAGDYVAIKDYAGTFDTNSVTVGRNGSNIQGNANDSELTIGGAGVTLVYVDATKGWLYTKESNSSFISATGGTVTTSGDYKIHTFTGDGCFTVSCVGNVTGGGNEVSYLVVAGGGGGGKAHAGGGGGGGFREGKASNDTYTASPLNAPTGLTVTATTYPVTVGAGGADYSPSPTGPAKPGSNSVFSSITSTGGGGGVYGVGVVAGQPGGSGGGGGNTPVPFGLGNTPPVSPPQGQPGAAGVGGPSYQGGGGGGATEAGSAGTTTATPTSGNGGDGAGTLINPATGETSGCTQYYSGGGGGSAFGPHPFQGPFVGGLGGGGDAIGSEGACSQDGSANTGGGGAGGSTTGTSGGKGIVIIRYKYQ